MRSRCVFCNSMKELVEVIDIAGEPDNYDAKLCKDCRKENNMEG